MAGLYLHIPFCKKACHYCNFHFSTSIKLKDRLLEALANECKLRHQYLKTRALTSIYLGGGTPSLLSYHELMQIFDQISTYFDFNLDTEITLEANPDDLNNSYLKKLSMTPVNRLSIGIQSFQQGDLQYMNRAHTATEAMVCVPKAQDTGFDNINIDLIYGTPTLSNEAWEQNLSIFRDLQVSHLSAYALTIEPNTALHHFISKGKSKSPAGEQMAQQFTILMEFMQQNAWLHYEISNFALLGTFAIHNTNYWKGRPYLGLGPSAHSYDGSSRQWNIDNNMKYIRAIEGGEKFYDREVLTLENRYQEYILTGLRTMWGVCKEEIIKFGKPYVVHFEKQVIPLVQQGSLFQNNTGNYVLTNKGKLFADRITAQFF